MLPISRFLLEGVKLLGRELEGRSPSTEQRRDQALLAFILASVLVVEKHKGHDEVSEGGWLSTQTINTAFASIPWIQSKVFMIMVKNEGRGAQWVERENKVKNNNNKNNQKVHEFPQPHGLNQCKGLPGSLCKTGARSKFLGTL